MSHEARIIDGALLQQALFMEITLETATIQKEHSLVPGLVTVLVGDNPASQVYVQKKLEAARRLGFQARLIHQPKTVSQRELVGIINRLNDDDSVHGILVQLPLPSGLDSYAILGTINPDKDVDGLHPLNAGRLSMGGTLVRFPPCTPAAIQEMLRRMDVSIPGAEVVVVGRSNIVGRPIATMLSHEGTLANATVTLVHTETRNIERHCRRADILIVAVGQPRLVRSDWIKAGACVIDVGINKIGERQSHKDPSKTIAVLCGDVDFDEVKKVAGWITPVPGGVGPMTIAMLMRNTLQALKYRLDILSNSL